MPKNLPINIICLSIFMLYAMLPAGYMPSIGKNGKVALVVCSIEGQKTVFVNDEELPHTSSDEEHNSTTPPCPYAVIAFADKAPEPAQLVATETYKAVSYHISQVSKLEQKHYSHYQSRGPPTFIL